MEAIIMQDSNSLLSETIWVWLESVLQENKGIVEGYS